MSGSKIARKGEFVIGFSGSVRFMNIVEHGVDFPVHPDGMSSVKYLVSHFVESIRVATKGVGFTKIENSQESNESQMLVVYRGWIYKVDGNYGLVSQRDQMYAIGGGAEYALGALAALRRVSDPIVRIRRALEISAEFNIGVGGPFQVEKVYE